MKTADGVKITRGMMLYCPVIELGVAYLMTATVVKLRPFTVNYGIEGHEFHESKNGWYASWGAAAKVIVERLDNIIESLQVQKEMWGQDAA